MAQLAGGFIPTGEHGDYVQGEYNPGTRKVHQYKQLGKDNAIQLKKGEKEPPGWAIIVLGFGDDPSSDNGPLTVTWNDWAMSIPRNVRVAIPPGHFGNLLNTSEKRYHQPHTGTQLVGYWAHRYNIQVLKWPEKLVNANGIARANEVMEETKGVYEKIEVS